MRGHHVVALVLAILAGWPAAASAQGTFDPIDLKQRLYQYRDDHNIPAGRNVAVYEFEYPDKSRGTIAVDSEPFTDPKTRGDRIQGHSERRAAEILNSYGIKDEQVKRIHSDRQPCMLPGAYCERMISNRFPKADVTWDHEYGPSEGVAPARQRRDEAGPRGVEVPQQRVRAAEADIAPVRAFGEPAMVEIGPMPYPVMNTLLDDAFPKGALNYWKANFVETFDDGLIDVVVERFAAVPSPMSAILFEHLHGEVTRIPVESAAVAQRDEGYNLLIPGVWMDPAETDTNIAWTRETYDALRPYFRAGRWLNYLGDDEPAEAIRAAYGPNYERLVEVKRKYDPENVFHLNHNIDPAG